MRALICGLVLSATVTCLLAAEPDAGFTLLFNGKDLTGWKVQKSGESLEGKSEAAKGRFKVVDGVLVIDEKIKGDVRIESLHQFSGDVVIQFEYKPGKGCNNDLLLRGLKFDLKPQDVKNQKQDEWNQFEIAIHGDQAEFKNNGEVQRAQKTKSAESGLVIRAEFGPIQIRKLQYK